MQWLPPFNKWSGESSSSLLYDLISMWLLISLAILVSNFPEYHDSVREVRVQLILPQSLPLHHHR